jgi:hypothetical protein
MSPSTSGMNNDLQRLDRPPVLAKRLPASGKSAPAASALIQAALGLDFTLSGLNELASPHDVAITVTK